MLLKLRFLAHFKKTAFKDILYLFILDLFFLLSERTHFKKQNSPISMSRVFSLGVSCLPLFGLFPTKRRFVPPAWQAGLWPVLRLAAGPDGCLPELDYLPCCKVVCLWCIIDYVLLLLRCFSCSHTVLPKEHSLGVIFFLLPFLMLCCIFLQFPVFLSCLPPCHIVCMLCMYGQVDG